jgi:hypothetical protein
MHRIWAAAAGLVIAISAPAAAWSHEHQMVGGPGLGELEAMIWKYTARCALMPDQVLEATDAATGGPRQFPGSLGLAPEWYAGTCDAACKEKVSSCLIALMNRTGKSVRVSLLSAAPSMRRLQPSRDDAGFPHQEGTFFGDVFSREAYACRGREAASAAQVKRFCALEPASCTDLVQFQDAGRCEDVCEMSCSRLPDGSQRCAASACRDPRGRRWQHPVTVYLRNQIEAGNADETKGLAVRDQALEDLDGGDSATFRRVDLGGRAATTFAATFGGGTSPGRIEIWLDGRRRLGVLPVRPTGDREQEQTAILDTAGVTGEHDVVLRLVGGRNLGRLSTIEFR